jgi:hypothetical protein
MVEATMTPLVTRVVLYSPLALLYGAFGIVVARLCISRLKTDPKAKRWLFCVVTIGLFSPVVVLTSAVGAFVVPIAGAFVGAFLWHPLNALLILAYSLVCLSFAKRWFNELSQAGSTIPWSWSVFLRWLVGTLVLVPVVSLLSLLVPPAGFLVAMLWIALTPGGALLILLAVALVVSSLAAVLKADGGQRKSQVPATPVDGAPASER